MATSAMKHRIFWALAPPASTSTRCWKPPSTVPAPRSHPSVPPLPSPSLQRRRRSGVMNAAGGAGPPSSELEVEQKFAIADAVAAKRVERKLASLGFEVSRREEFADWYFDLPAPRWHFSLRDCWFRYREKRVKMGSGWGWRGAWQVKRGKEGCGEGDDAYTGARGAAGDGMTVYEELQGKDAKELIVKMLNDLDDGGAGEGTPCSTYNGYDVPYLAGAGGLVPFARLKTFRTCYEPTNDGEFRSLKVDVDKTDFGYMVGEVEAVIGNASQDEQVDAAKEKIRKLVHLISSEGESGTLASIAVIGKLEQYLINNHPDHYEACVESGVIGAMMN
ncbi:hypothetical protein ACHAWF_006009 [Thalassiosira exigua]